MLARANFDQAAAFRYAVSDSRLLGALAALPQGVAHRALVAAAWLETWVRFPLRTLRMMDSVDGVLSVLDPGGSRFGLTGRARNAFRKNLLYYQVADLAALLFSLNKPGFGERTLRVENEDVLLSEMERGPGAIVAGFRIGPYPAVPMVLGTLGFNATMIVGNEGLAQAGRALGEKYSPGATGRIRYVGADDPRVLTRCLDDLDAGGLACTLVELSPTKFAKTVEVQFLGWTIAVPYGIAYLAAATRRSIVPLTLSRRSGTRFSLRFGQPLPAPARSRQAIGETMQQLYGALEGEVLRLPDQWIGWTLLTSHLGIDLPATDAQVVTPLF